MQQFFEAMRSIYNDSRRLNIWSFPFIERDDPCAPPKMCDLEIHPGDLKTLGNLQTAVDAKTGFYQDIRPFANGVMRRKRPCHVSRFAFSSLSS
jgi:hypothetical protein